MSISNNYRRLMKCFHLIKVPKYRRALWLSVGAAIEHENFLRGAHCKDIAIIFDVGANKGQFSLAANHCIPNAAIYAFEPLETPSVKFNKLFSGNSAVNFFQIGISTSSMEQNIQVSNKLDSSSMLPITTKQSEIFPGTQLSHTEKISTEPLAKFMPESAKDNSCLLKVDVQGFELEVLKSSESILRKIKTIYVECSFVELYRNQPLAEEVITWLQDKGFTLAGFGTPITFDEYGNSVQGDFIFTKNRLTNLKKEPLSIGINSNVIT
jgi:FkbM family methyltransferase